jgi:hypothetical protein
LEGRKFELTNIAQANNISEKRVDDLISKYSDDVERLMAYIVQTADRRKAAIDQESLNKAQGIYDAALKRSEAAGKEIAKLGALRGLAMKARESASADEKTAL